MEPSSDSKPITNLKAQAGERLIDLKDRIMGGILGIAVGDALGLPVQFISRSERDKRPIKSMEGWGTFNMPPGSWSDDTSLTLCLAESLLEKDYNLEDLGERFLRWYRDGYWTPAGFSYDVGGSTMTAMQRLAHNVPTAEAGPRDDSSNGNGSLMRILPAAVYLNQQKVWVLYENPFRYASGRCSLEQPVRIYR